MRQLTGLDATWLYLETETSPLHIASVNVFEYPEDPQFSAFDAARAQFGSRVPLIEPLRRRLVEVPLGLSRPYWVMDPDFDLDAHVHHVVLSESGDDAFAAFIGELMSEELDRTRPLWEAHVVEGFADDRWAIVSKYHHATIDGGAGIMLAHLLFDSDPDARAEIPEQLVPDAERIPSAAELMSKAGVSLVTNPRKLVKLQVKMARHVAAQIRADGVQNTARLAGSSLRALLRGSSPDADVQLPVRAAPPTPWNASIGRERHVAFSGMPIADILSLKTAMNGTVNDVVMTACAGGLRRYLIEHDALPEDPLLAAVPVTRRTGAETDPWKNLISVILPTVPTHEAEALDRFAAVQQGMKRARAVLDLAPDDALEDAADLAPALIVSAAAQLASRLRLADRVGTPANLTISNVAGPRAPLYVSGAKITNLTPVSLLTDGAGLNITVLSCVDRLDIGLVACVRAVPDLGFMLDCILAEFDELFELTGTTRG